ncbi:uncharacterized protein IWZ02DRAFT_495044 [Phyllosticta citriasiana]|uniref:uncharacterized protein n=1 Tax=Phyllosticta citriasiana TaxID=595635 RepID=UPI0030FDF474
MSTLSGTPVTGSEVAPSTVTVDGSSLFSAISYATSVETAEPLGALTTTFTPPPDCPIGYRSALLIDGITLSGDYSTFSTPTYVTIAQLAKKCSNGLQGDAVSCWPSASSTPYADDLRVGGFFSPGLFCPVGYSTACASAASANPGFTCDTTISDGHIQGSVKVADSSTSLSDCLITSWPDNGWASRFYNNITIFQAPMIQLNWREEDRIKFNNSLQPSSPATFEEVSNNNQGLRTTTIVTISVVVPVVSLILLIGSIVWLLHRRKARLLRAQQDEQERLDLDKEDGKFHGPELPREGSAIMELLQPSAELHDPHAEHFLRAQRSTAELPERSS